MMNADLEDKKLNEWLDENKSQRKALKTILNSIEKEEVEPPHKTMDPNKPIIKNKLNIMSKITQLFKKLGVFILPLLLAGSMSLHAQNSDFVPGKIRVKIEANAVTLVAQSLNETTDNTAFKTGVSSFDKLNAKFGANKMTRVFPFAGKNEGTHMKHGLHLWYEISVDSEEDLLTVADAYTDNEAIIISEPVRVKTLSNYRIVEAPYEESAAAAFTTDDPYLSDQWHYSNNGTLTNSVAGSDINLFNAWEITKGSPNVIVSVVDGGIDVDHLDLEDNVWINEAELNGQTGVDDDFNGFIDDINGFNFAENKGEITAHDHGTHVAGTVAAVSNNGKGVAGVAGGSGNKDGVRLMSSQVFSNDGAGNFAAAIVYGADNGAVISQNSWGYMTPGNYEQAVLDAIDYFITEAGNYAGSPMKGGVVLFAAGNNGRDEMHYPGYYESPITVGSIGTDFTKAYYSNYGAWVDIATVGGDARYGTKSQILSTLPDNKYGYMQGTSMATPHATGVAALIVSKYGSATFTNTELKQRFMSGVKDIDQYNPDFVGKLGVGYIDAVLALADDDKTAPNTITDLVVSGTSQDFANVSWSIPADAGDGTPLNYMLYTAKDAAFTDKSTTVINNDFRNAGEIMEQSVVGLEPLTTYYFAVVAIDRWGNTSQMSNITETTTNSGPDIATDVANISMDINAVDGTTGVDQFEIQNNDTGILNWKAITREVRFSADYNKIQYPDKGTQKSVNEVDVLKQSIELVEKFASNDAGTDAWERQDLNYTSLVKYVVGDIDTTMTNSSATRFVVAQEEGFNLTQVSSYLRLDNEDGPVVMEVYQGEEIKKENLVYATDAIKGYRENDARTFSHFLTEQLFFENGETFWVVFHVPAGNLYPLGIGYEANPGDSDNCLMSFDLGETWQPMAGAIENDNFVWVVTATSAVEPLHKYVTLSPADGSINGIGTEDVAVDVDASQLINGTYKSNIVINSNDSDTPNHRVPLQVKVVGHKPELSSTSILDFGSVFNGLSSTKEMTLSNSGYGRFKTKTISSSDPQFKVESSTYGLNVPALDEKPLVITFTPNGIGNQNAVITMTSYLGDVYTFNVFGVGTEPAEISVDPLVFNFDNVMVGDQNINDVITVTNTGQYPLQYGFPNFADDLSHIENLPVNTQRFGYTMEKMDYPIDFVFNDITATGTDITEFFKKDPRNEFYKVDLGFDFPYFGENLNEMYITKRGVITVGEDGNFNATSTFHGSHMPDGYISAVMREFAVTKSGSIHYKYELGKLIVQYTNVRHANDRETISYTFQIELDNNGDIKMIFDKLDGLSSWSLKGLYTAIENVAKNDGVLLNSNSDKVVLPHKAHQIVHIHSPGIGLIKNVEESKGTIQPGESKELLMTLDSDKLIEGTFKEYISVVSNDPFNNSQIIEVNIDVVGGGVSNLELSEENIAVGKVFQNAVVKGVIAAKNIGSKEITLSNIKFENSQLNYLGEQNITIGPNQTLFLHYELPTSELMIVADTLVITDQSSNEYKVGFTGEIIDAPVVEVVESSYTIAMDPDMVMTKNFTVKNTGKETLEYAVVGSEHVSLVEEEAAVSNVPDFTYTYRTTYDEVDKPSHQWFKLTEEDKVPFYLADNDFWETIELPFEFEFYQEKYTKVQMGTQGVLTFDEVEDDLLFFTPPQPGQDDKLNNFIAPYFAAGGPLASLPEDQWGRYAKFYEDKVVFEWRNYINIFGFGGTYSFQAVLYKNGNIKYQYKNNPAEPPRQYYGLIGLENKDGSDGLQLAYYQDYADNGQAVEIVPAVKRTLMPNAEQVFDLNISTIDANAGVYKEVVKVFSNDPVNPKITVPVDLTVSGEAVLTFNPEVIDLGEQMVAPNTSFVKEFSFSNLGKRSLTVSNLRVEDGATGKIEHLLFNSRWGWRWYELKATDSFEVEPGFESKSFRLTITPSEPNDAYVNKVLADTDYGTTEELPIHATFKLPPNFTVNDASIYHMAFNEDIFSHTLNLGNVEGQSPLKYGISLNYEREDATAAKEVISKTGLESVLLKNKIDMGKNATATAVVANTFANVLAHDDKTEVDTSVGFNGTNVFTTSTSFVAPETGFNLSHVQTWYIPEDWLSSELNVEIRVGDQIENARVLHTELLNYTIDAPDSYGELVTLKLNKEIKLLPYEKFYVIFSYPLGVNYPQGCVKVSEPVTKRYQYYSGGFWWDIYDTGLNEYGWMTRAAEETQSGLNWISINGNVSGAVETGQTSDVVVELHPERAMYVNNEAQIQIETNDPDALSTFIPVTLDINQAPTLMVEDKYMVNEAETLSVDMLVVDNEGDMVSNTSLAMAYDNAMMSYADGVATFVYTPTYEDAGYHTFEVVTEDENGITANYSVNVEVVDVNRPPVANAIETQYVNINGGDYTLVLAEGFTDPDGDVDLTYQHSFSDTEVAEGYYSETSLLVKPLKVGTTTLTVTGIDAQGAFSTNDINIVVVDNVTSDSVLKNSWKVHPNPVEETMMIKMYSPVMEEVNVKIINTLGAVVKMFTMSEASDALNVPVSNLKPGVYFVELSTQEAKSVRKIVKN